METVTPNPSGNLPGKLAGLGLFIAILAAIIYGTGYFGSSDRNLESGVDGQVALDDMDMSDALARGQWPQLEKISRRRLELDQFDGVARFNLAYSLDRLGKYDEAMEQYEIARDHIEYRQFAEFNLAILHARRGETDAASEHLELALKAGFVSQAGIENVPELEALREREVFQEFISVENANRLRKTRGGRR